MNSILKASWLEALRSGRYKQDRGKLRTENGFCCLGVLCDVIDSNSWDWFELPDGGKSYIHGNDTSYVTSMKYGNCELYQIELSNMNDRGKSFSEIADYIEKNVTSESSPDAS